MNINNILDEIQNFYTSDQLQQQNLKCICDKKECSCYFFHFLTNEVKKEKDKLKKLQVKKALLLKQQKITNDGLSVAVDNFLKEAEEEIFLLEMEFFNL